MASIKDLKRMCESYGDYCTNCPLYNLEKYCAPNVIPDNTDEIVDKWVQEHPVKTYADDFFEKFPNAQSNGFGIPLMMCVYRVYNIDVSDCGVISCHECWNREMKVSRPASNTETCVCCGAEIPEGRQVCPACENGEDK